jgi:cation:H+ antiporter
MMSLIIALLLFVIGAGLAVFATERLLEGLVSLALLLRLSAFAVGAVLSGLEAENIAVGLAAGGRGAAEVSLGTVFGGAIFLVCVALGVAALLFPLEVQIPRGVLAIFAASPLLAGLPLLAPVTPRWTGVILLLAWALAMGYLVRISRHRQFLLSKEVAESQEKRRPLWKVVALTVFGLLVIGMGGEMVATGAEQLIALFGVPALFMGMIVTPAAIELEEVARQVVPSKRGRHDVSAGNLIGTLLYFVLFNLGFIALLTPVRVDPQVLRLDWPLLILVTWIATGFLWRKRVGRVAGGLLLLAYVVYVMLHVLFRSGT